MNKEILMLFIILLLALVLCSFLGGSNCSGKEGFISWNFNGTYSGPNGVKAVVTDNTIVFTNNGNVTTLTKSSSSGTTYTSVNGYKATFDSNGKLVITDSQGNDITVSSTSTSSSSSSNNSTSNYDNYNHYDGSSYPTIYYGPNNSTAKVINVDGKGQIVITNANGTTNIYYIDNNTSSMFSSTKTYKGPNGGTAVITTDSSGKKMVKIMIPGSNPIIYSSDNTYASKSQDPTINQYYGPSGGQATVASGPNGNKVAATSTNYNSSVYASSLPTGIPASQIPAGEEDLYILKSEVVPPVCPKCPDPIIQASDEFDTSKCPPCPPCARCPEPAFDCKKVPNYNSFNPDFMPVPVLSDFSSFGM